MAEDDGPESPLDDLFVDGARFREPSHDEARTSRRKLRPWILLGVLAVGAYLFFPNGGIGATEHISLGRAHATRLRVVYVVPDDAIVGDRAEETIRRYVTIADTWFAAQTGRHLRIELQDGQISVERVNLAKNQQFLDSHDSYKFVRAAVNKELSFKQDELPLLFVASATSRPVCGEAADFALVWLGNGRCDHATGLTLEQPTGPPKTAAHEIVHALGGVPSCAPHETSGHHVNDDPHDLMFEGGNRLAPLQLDVGFDDYFNHARNGCLDIADAKIWLTK